MTIFRAQYHSQAGASISIYRWRQMRQGQFGGWSSYLHASLSEQRSYCGARRTCVALPRCVCVCLSAEPRLHVRCINLGGEGNALYTQCSLVHPRTNVNQFQLKLEGLPSSINFLMLYFCISVEILCKFLRSSNGSVVKTMHGSCLRCHPYK